MLVIAVLGCGKSADNPRSTKHGPGRPSARACPKERPPGRASPDIEGDCKKDDDCTAGTNGRCWTNGPRVQRNSCTYDACFHDADCKGGPCECRSDSGNVCLQGNCKTDADCGAGGSCGRSNSMTCGGGEPAYYCRTQDDTCSDYNDCGKGQCVYLPELGHWGCKAYPDCPVG